MWKVFFAVALAVERCGLEAWWLIEDLWGELVPRRWRRWLDTAGFDISFTLLDWAFRYQTWGGVGEYGDYWALYLKVGPFSFDLYVPLWWPRREVV